MNTICTYPGCATPITPTAAGKYCSVHKRIVKNEQAVRYSAQQNERLRQMKNKKPKSVAENIDCPFWQERSCDILTEKVCKTVECGFYPPTAEKRKAERRNTQ